MANDESPQNRSVRVLHSFILKYDSPMSIIFHYISEIGKLVVSMCSFIQEKSKWIDDNDDIDAGTLKIASILVFVLATVLVSISAIIVNNALLTFITKGELWMGYDVLTEGGVRPVLIGFLSPQLGLNLTLIALIFVIGQVLHQVNVLCIEYAKWVSIIGLTSFSVSLLFAFTSPHRIVWVLSMQILALAGYAGVIGIVSLVRTVKYIATRKA